MLTNEQVIEEMLNLGKANSGSSRRGQKSSDLQLMRWLSTMHLQNRRPLKTSMRNEELIAITRELTDTLRKNRTIDWQKRESAEPRCG